MKVSVRDRLEEIYRRLARSPRTGSAVAAFQELCDTLEQVEDELSGVPKQTPPPWPSLPDGRMYCPSDDFIRRNPDGSWLAMARGHRIEITADGGIQIMSRLTGRVEFKK